MSKNDRDNADYKAGYDAGRDGTGGAYATARFFIGENDSEKAGREAGEADKQEYGSRD